MVYFLLITAFTVSIDSFICGFGLSLGGGKKLPILLGVGLTVLAMCFITNYTAYFLADKFTDKTASFGGLILIALGIFNLIKKPSNKDATVKRSVWKQAIVSGFAVGLDGALGNLSLSLMGINDFYVPIVIALMHVLLIYLGIVLSNTKLISKVKKFEFVAPVILILLGCYKLISLFI